ncbi:GerAB/ArcD/ProY family transporter [Cohnella terricola]|uniref:GerAB/ArcD/ProY family transporter n=1 Tax=Cohnella terricola TaxID=1289167 RepID=A0A559JGR5_9BACL|nr:endospore germination permease [Cohnella terricola]TVX99058.1 GerAB/ArcD/ProY family transporter [Cohnella terricola]
MRISGRQLFWLVFSIEIMLAMLYSVSATVTAAGQDTWISMLLAGLIGLGIVLLIVKLSMRYPQQTFVQYSQTIMGKWAGRLLIVPYFIMWIFLNSMVLRNSADFVYLALFTKTPLYVIMVTLMILVVYVVFTGGLTGIARCGELMGPIILVVILGTCLLSINHLNWHLLTPVFWDSGGTGILKGTLPAAAFYGDVIMFSMVFAFMSNPKQALSRTMWGIALSSVLVLFGAALVIMTFGPELPARMWAPFFGMTRFISVLGFIQNVDIFVVVIWLFSAFIKLSLFLFVTVYGTAQWLNLKNWRSLIWVLAPLILIFALLPQNATAPIKDYVQQFWLPYVIPINVIGIPLLLWGVSMMRGKSSQRKERPE